MKTEICDLLNIELPILAFSHCRDVVAEVSRCGGFGVLGAALLSPEELDYELSWIDEHSGGRPYGVDLLVPVAFEGKEGASNGPVAVVSPEVRDFVDGMMQRYDIDPESVGSTPVLTVDSLSVEAASKMVDVALIHGVGLVASALGPPPPRLREQCTNGAALLAGLAGSPQHAVRQVQAGVDIVVAAGYEAGGHTGQIGTMVLVPEVINAVEKIRHVPVLAAGGIVTGSQIAAARALGASGVWTGSLWLTTHEAETAPYTKKKMLSASSADTVRSKARTGKPARQLRSAWHDEWEQPDAPPPPPMPLMGQLADPILKRVDVLAEAGRPGAQALSTYYVGQGVGLMTTAKSVRQVILDLMEDYIEAASRVVIEN